MTQITVIIATSMKRTDWLINRSLASVYQQEKINSSDINVLVVDDNKDKNELCKIIALVKNLREKCGFTNDEFATNVFRNTRTKNNSGTGAWNTGIIEAHKKSSNGFISILDDDDEYLSHHLASCLSKINKNTIGVFQSLEWRNTDSTIFNFPLNIEEMTPKNFFVGNPGVQGSNMFFKTKALIDINMFDESLPNTTDRDLMIRFLSKIKSRDDISVSRDVSVLHYNHNQLKVNSNLKLKQIGLDLFFAKHKNKFSLSDFEDSKKRANLLFNYQYNKA